MNDDKALFFPLFNHFYSAYSLTFFCGDGGGGETLALKAFIFYGSVAGLFNKDSKVRVEAVVVLAIFMHEVSFELYL